MRAAAEILATPGRCAIDFETWPTSPAWHGEQAARAAPRGKQGAAREQARQVAERDGRAHARAPCVLALAHESGGEAVLQIEAGDLPRLFERRRAALVAHNAAFEAEIPLQAGVAADLDCSLLAAKCLYLVAVPEDLPQPVEFGLADLVAREFGRPRDKTIRDRDWRAPLDAVAVEYCLQDARDALELWRLYRSRLEELGLLEGYEAIRQAILPTSAINLIGMVFDRGAHTLLVETLRAEAGALERELDARCDGAIENPASGAQVAAWAMQVVLGDG
jgi:hypothetical protein